jgi:hypothetical protein
LGWSTQIALQGSSTAFQIVCNKNQNNFDRKIWIGQTALGEQKYALNKSDSKSELPKSKPAPTKSQPQPEIGLQ